jgi:hypothetical protein
MSEEDEEPEEIKQTEVQEQPKKVSQIQELAPIKRRLGIIPSKRYGLFRRPRNQKRYLVAVSGRFMVDTEVDSMLEGGLDPDSSWTFARIDSENQVKKILWTRDRVGTRAPTSGGRAPWEKLKEDVLELTQTVQPIADGIRSLRTALDSLKFGGEEKESAPVTVTPVPQTDAFYATAFQKMNEAYASAFSSMASAMVKSFSDAAASQMFPWSVPSDFPMTIRILSHPGVRQGMKDLINDLITEPIEKGAEAVAKGLTKGAMGSTPPKPTVNLGEIVQEEARVVVKE